APWRPCVARAPWRRWAWRPASGEPISPGTRDGRKTRETERSIARRRGRNGAALLVEPASVARPPPARAFDPALSVAPGRATGRSHRARGHRPTVRAGGLVAGGWLGRRPGRPQ